MRFITDSALKTLKDYCIYKELKVNHNFNNSMIIARNYLITNFFTTD